MSNLKSRLAIIGVLIAVSLFALFPRDETQRLRRADGTFYDTTVTRIPLKRGLDLSGGMHLKLEVDESTRPVTDKADAIARAMTVVRSRIDGFGVSEPIIQKSGDDRIIVELPGIDDRERAIAVVQDQDLVRQDDGAQAVRHGDCRPPGLQHPQRARPPRCFAIEAQRLILQRRIEPCQPLVSLPRRAPAQLKDCCAPKRRRSRASRNYTFRLKTTSLVRRNRNFRLLWFGQLVSQLGDWFNTVAVYALLYEITGSATAVAGMMVVQFLPIAVVGPMAGVIVDRIDRRRPQTAPGDSMTTKYTEEHEWINIEDHEAAVVGITLHAQDALGDVVFVELPEVGRVYKKGEIAGVVESVKAAADVYMPIAGEVTEVNEDLRADPALANRDPMGNGWFFKILIKDMAEFDELMDEPAYAKFTKSH